jgi:hypothetical protein
MSVPFTTVLLISAFISFLILIIVIVLIIPLRISLSLFSSESCTKGTLTGMWLIFGLEVMVSEGDPQASVMVGRTRLIMRPLSPFMSPSQKDTGFSGANRSPDIISLLPAFQGPILDAVLDLINHTRFDYARGTAQIGFGDPSATGMVYGLYRAARPLMQIHRITLNIVPVFNREIYEIDVNTRFHIIYPVRMIVNAVKVVKHPAVRRVMKTMRKKPGDVAV